MTCVNRHHEAMDCGWSGPRFRWDEERRFLLRCELDAAFFHLYGLNRDDSACMRESGGEDDLTDAGHVMEVGALRRGSGCQPQTQ